MLLNTMMIDHKSFNKKLHVSHTTWPVPALSATMAVFKNLVCGFRWL